MLFSQYLVKMLIDILRVVGEINFLEGAKFKDVFKMGNSRVICIANQKGGVGKTTTTINLAYAISASQSRTLIVDLDPQCNATSGIGVKPLPRHPLVIENPIEENIFQCPQPNLFLLPGSQSFRDVDMLATNGGQEGTQLIQHLAIAASTFDYVLIDCPPSLGNLTQMALAASDEVFMPIQCEYFAMEGLTQMIDVIRQVMKAKDGKLNFGGIVLTMYDHNLELTAEVDEEVRDFFGEIVFDTVIPRDVCVAEAPSHGVSVIEYAPRSRGSRAYIELCMEVLERD